MKLRGRELTSPTIPGVSPRVRRSLRIWQQPAAHTRKSLIARDLQLNHAACWQRNHGLGVCGRVGEVVVEPPAFEVAVDEGLRGVVGVWVGGVAAEHGGVPDAEMCRGGRGEEEEEGEECHGGRDIGGCFDGWKV